jgi:hypothetical protein
MESLKVSLKQSTLIELGNGILVTNFPFTRCYVLLNTFLVAQPSIALNCATLHQIGGLPSQSPPH